MSKKKKDKDWFYDVKSVEELSNEKYGFEDLDSPSIDDLPNWVSVAKTAEKLGVCKSTVKNMIKSGDLHGKKFSIGWRVLCSSIAKYMKAG